MSLSITDKANPKPCTLTTLTLYLRNLKDKDGKAYDLSGASKIYATIKDSLANADNAATVQIDTVNNPTQFVTTYLSTGNLDVVFSTTDTNLTADATYYIDVVALYANGNKISLVSDTIIFQTPATKSVS